MKKEKDISKIKLDSPSTMLNPIPVVMVSSKGLSPGFDKDNIITIAWVGTVNSEPPMVSVSIRKSRHTHRQISESKEFTVNLVSSSILKACDFCGVKSGKDYDKYKECNLEKEKSDVLEHACGIKNSPVTMYCKVRQTLELGSHDMFIGEILSVTANEALFDRNGKIDFAKADLSVYSHGDYYSLSENIGFFGFSVAREEVLKRRMSKKK